MNLTEVVLELERTLRRNVKNRAIAIKLESKLILLLNDLRRSLQSEADTGSARSDDRLGLDMEGQGMPG